MRYWIIICLGYLIALPACKKSGTPEGNTGSNSSSKSITSFIFKAADNPGLTADVIGIISSDTILLSIPYNVNILSLKPTIVHTGKSISPASGSPRNFSVTIGYTVTATDNTSKIYKVIVMPGIEGTVYIGSNDGNLYALDAGNGSLKWTFATVGPISLASPTYANGTVFICGADRYLYAIDAVTGTQKWKFLAAQDISWSTPSFYNGNLYFGTNSSNSTRYSVNAATGTLNWQRTGTYRPSNITVANNKGYFGHFSGLMGIDLSNGDIVNVYHSSICHESNPLVVNGIIYNGGELGFRAQNVNTGAILWTYPDICLKSSPTLKNGTIYNSGTSLNRIYAIDSATGTLRWQYTANFGQFSSPTVENNIVYVGNMNSVFYAFNASLGNLIWQFGTVVGGQSAGPVGTVAGNLVYFGSYNKNIYCLNAHTGAVRWQFATGGAVYSAPLIVTSNIVYRSSISGEQQ